MDPIEQFQKERSESIAAMSKDEELKAKSLEWMLLTERYKYCYNFTWLGRPIIKYPTDIIAMQEAIWKSKPTVILETGIAHGGSLIFSASMLEMIGGEGRVIGVDIDIRSHNRAEIESHPMMKRITMFEGSSTDPVIVDQVKALIKPEDRVMVVLDSLHTHAHVLDELRIFAPLVTKDCYLVLPDTFIEKFPKGFYSKDRPWDVGNNPMTALIQYLKETDCFQIDSELVNKLEITEAFDGYLLRVK